MNRAGLILYAVVVLASCLAPKIAAAATESFNTAGAASVWAASLAYIAPRALQQASIPQMTEWGLNGLTALDPDITVTVVGGQLHLNGASALLLALAAPAPDDAPAWGRAAAALAAAAYAASPALQQAGTQGVISSFFDELFNHFDPYSRYEAPVQAAQDQLMITGLAGAGLSLGRQGAAVVIADVAADGPAAEAGLTAGTRVLAIDGRPVYPAELAALNNGLNGIAGTTTTLRLADPDNPSAPLNVPLVRALIPPQTVFPQAFGGQAISLKISAFNAGTSDNFSAALVAAMAAHPAATGLLIDLRGDRGGVLRQAVLVADSLLAQGLIAEAVGRDPAADQMFRAEGADLTAGMRLVVLVDGQTASAAEILAAALADNRRAVVVGSETLGKGLVQTLTALPDGGELYVTWSRVLAPRQWPLQALGLMPQICTSLGIQALASQLSALQKGHNLLAPAVAATRTARAPPNVDAILRLRAACPAAIGGDLDLVAARAALSSKPVYEAALLP